MRLSEQLTRPGTTRQHGHFLQRTKHTHPYQHCLPLTPPLSLSLPHLNSNRRRKTHAVHAYNPNPRRSSYLHSDDSNIFPFGVSKTVYIQTWRENKQRRGDPEGTRTRSGHAEVMCVSD